MSEPLVINDALTIPASELVWMAVRASGPGGQNVNKVSSKVELKFDLAHSTVLDGTTRGRLRTLAGRRVDSDGWLHLASQKTRDQQRNLEDAREKLRAMILVALERPKPRKATRPSLGAKRRRLDEKKRVGERKRERSTTAED